MYIVFFESCLFSMCDLNLDILFDNFKLLFLLHLLFCAHFGCILVSTLSDVRKLTYISPCLSLQLAD